MISVHADDRGVQALFDQLRTELGVRTATRILRRTLRRACTEIRGQVRSHQASAPVQRAAAATLGYKVITRGGKVAAKLGFGLRRRGGTRWREQHLQGQRPGAGLSERNIHWAILGTDPRKTKKGYDRGQMPAYYRGFLGGFSSRIQGLLYEQALCTLHELIVKATQRL